MNLIDELRLKPTRIMELCKKHQLVEDTANAVANEALLKFLKDERVEIKCPECKGLNTIGSHPKNYDAFPIEPCLCCKGTGYQDKEELIKQIKGGWNEFWN